ncbi:glutamyl aminopeptidase-like [Apostichopus japonicus]|uniref:glutamyl aminopeptidase-like n=1 Tax=Stichopus japonicus TaxID=307972 RepID=UPI003AB882E2
MAKNDQIHLSTGQFWAITFLVLILCLFVGLMCGLTPACVEPEIQSSLEEGAADRNRRAAEPYEDLRLPPGIKPTRYTLELDPDLNDVTNNFTGSVQIEITVTEPTEYPRVHIKEMTILSSEITPKSGPAVNIVDEFFYPENEFYVLDVGGALPIGEYTISLTFTGSLLGHIVGFYKSTYTTPDGEERALATSKFQPTDARRAFPCFDEPNLKATYITTLVHDKKYIALSNMDVESETDIGDDRVKTRFTESVAMSSYLACFIVCDFESKTKTLKSGKPFSVYAPDFQINQTDYALDSGAKITDFFEEYYAVEYPLPKLDMISIPDFSSGAMEHWGLITYRERYMLYDEQESSASNKQRILSVVSHELAHMWFGNIVTMDWWDDLWLNEGFASYVEYIGANHVEPDWQMFDQFVPTDMLYVFGLDQITTSHPIIVELENPDEINEVFDSIPYSKGASVLRMLNNFIGEESFTQGVTKYLEDFKFGTAVSDDLYERIQEAYVNNTGDTSIDVTRVMHTWTKQMGFPVVTITRTDTELQLEQMWFLVDPNANKSAALYGSDYDYRWEIPFTYQYKSDLSQVHELWMQWDDTDGDVIPFPTSGDDWYLANYEEMNFYRVNYDSDNWQKLSDQLMSDHTAINASDRAGLIDDAFNLGRAEQLNYDVVLDMTLYLEKETEYVPWTVASDNLAWLSEILRFQNIYGLFREYVVKQTTSIYASTGWGTGGAGSHLDRLLRSDIIDLACGHGNQDCLEEAVMQFNTFLSDGDVAPDIRSIVYIYGAQEMVGQDEWDIMWQAYENSQVASEKLRLLYGMAQTRQVWLLSRYLEYTKDETLIRTQDFFSVVTYISDNPVGNPLVWDWVRKNWDYLVDRFGTSNRYLGRLVPSITDFYSTELKLQEMQDFFEKYPDGGAGERGRKQALERVRTNINWVNKNVGVIEDWLMRNM